MLPVELAGTIIRCTSEFATEPAEALPNCSGRELPLDAVKHPIDRGKLAITGTQSVAPMLVELNTIRTLVP